MTPNGNIPSQPASNFAQLFGFDFLPIVTNPGPNGTGNFAARAGQTLTMTLGYTVVATGTTITGNELRISGQFPVNNNVPLPGVNLTGVENFTFCTAADGSEQDAGNCHPFPQQQTVGLLPSPNPVTDVNLNNWTSATVDKTFSAFGPNSGNQIVYLTLARDGFAVPQQVQAPEPSTWSLLGISLVAVGGLAWRRRKSVPDKAGDA